jgi:hypothetical protein
MIWFPPEQGWQKEENIPLAVSRDERAEFIDICYHE